jgi:hypothetical protein
VRSALGTGANGAGRALTRDDFYVPGSILRVAVNNRTPLGYGFEPAVDAFFDDSPAYRLDDGAEGAEKVAWFANGAPLRSGWAWGQRHLDGALAAIDARLGNGRVLMFGPEINFRAQSHGTFKFLFNGILLGKATAVPGIGGPGERP